MIVDALIDLRGAHPSTPSDWLVQLFGGGVRTRTGLSVSQETALSYTAFYACVRVLSDTVAQLPAITYERLQRGKQRAPGHPVYERLHLRPNPEMSAHSFFRTLTAHQVTWGNGYAEIQRDRLGRVLALWPIPPNRCEPMRDRESYELYYRVTLPNGKQVSLRPDDVLHVSGLGWDGVKGYSPVTLFRESISLGLALEEFGASYFGNGTHPGLVVSHPEQLSPDGHKNLETSLNQNYSSLGQSHRLMLLDEGMKVEKIGIPPEDSQFLESRRFQAIEMCRIMRVPPHKLGDLERATFSNVEQMGEEFRSDTMLPLLVNWEQAINWRLFTPRERERYFVEFLTDGLTRADINTRYQAYQVARYGGWMSADDIRERENMNPLPAGTGGDVYWQPVNMMPATDGAPLPALRSEVRAPALEVRAPRSEARRQLRRRYLEPIKQQLGEVVAREVADVGRAARRILGGDNPESFRDWLSEFYVEGGDHAGYYVRKMRAIVTSLGEAIGQLAAEESGAELSGAIADRLGGFLRDYVVSRSGRWCAASVARLTQAMDGVDDELTAVLGELGSWQGSSPRAASGANREHVRVAGAAAAVVWREAGVRQIRWVARTSSCPYCIGLNGRVVDIGQPFLAIGEEYQPPGADVPLRPATSISHEPAHAGCDCVTEAVLGD